MSQRCDGLSNVEPSVYAFLRAPTAVEAFLPWQRRRAVACNWVGNWSDELCFLLLLVFNSDGQVAGFCGVRVQKTVLNAGMRLLRGCYAKSVKCLSHDLISCTELGRTQLRLHGIPGVLFVTVEGVECIACERC